MTTRSAPLRTLYASGTQNQPIPFWSGSEIRFDTRSTGRHLDPDGQQPGGGHSSVVVSHRFTQMLLALSFAPPTVTHSIEFEQTPSMSPPHGPFTCS